MQALVVASLVRPQFSSPLGFLMNALSQARLPWPAAMIGPLRSLLSASWQLLHRLSYSARALSIGAVQNTAPAPVAGTPFSRASLRASAARSEALASRLASSSLPASDAN